jgi:hypothetical protein
VLLPVLVSALARDLIQDLRATDMPVARFVQEFIGTAVGAVIAWIYLMRRTNSEAKRNAL